MRYLLVAFAFITALGSCKKKSSDTPAPAADKPRVGTTWTYRYRTFDGSGTAYPPTSITIKATAEQSLGGESWISLDSASVSNWYKLKIKSDGLYQYANGASYLLCKDPAALNETYTGYNNTYTNTGKDTLTVKGVGITLDVPIDILVVNYYEGAKLGNVVEKIWYNSKYWILKKETYIVNPFSGAWHIDKRWEITNISF
jgi:hypothetical protein